MQGRRLEKTAAELVGPHRGDGGRVQLAAEAVPQVPGRAEGLLQRDLLVQDHADQEGERVLGEELVGLGVAGEMEHGANRSACPRPQARAQACAGLGCSGSIP